MKLASSFLTTLGMTLIGYASLAQNSGKWNLLVGTYTKGKSEGIYTYSFDEKTGETTLKAVTKGIKNPSFLAVSPNKKMVYAIHETDGGAVSSYALDPSTGVLTLRNTVATEGANSCYVTTDAGGKHVVSANYSGGNLSVHAVKEDGTLHEAKQVIQHSGKGPNARRQEKAHVHATDFTPDGKFLLVCDLGTDKVTAYPYKANSPQPLNEKDAIHSISAPGSGPRHLVFHSNKKIVYVLHELSGVVVWYTCNNGKLDSMGSVSILPENFKGSFTAAEIKISPDGKFLYASNRGDVNEIVVCSIQEKTGALRLVAHTPSGGKTPRFFEIDPSGNYLFAANQDSDNIVLFKRDQKTGLLTDTGKRIEVGAPTCIVFAAVPGK